MRPHLRWQVAFEGMVVHEEKQISRQVARLEHSIVTTTELATIVAASSPGREDF